ncbi:MAG: D-glycero-beta-D-manno-heptose-7-phosphate kinase [Candidatus Omnitrophica bacterium]|nr:D-glycero-beta-D-manno-heptose-7-phosphate kinase [Candidatus Omnitrophota bacterium]MDD5236149.1 D-glycero-beta-D-manno-heptose-7-phosphate kinase [Candidatus Omnitrophota bacterium]MDD5611352.1 D-glycero-beta-D-manno-heptose-7-phosphate kinase [Candidatus Omnitrophota bacterium]
MQDLKKIIQKFNRGNILVLGDLILDEFIWGDVDRISPEAPVPVVWAKKRSYMPGGAANVANNIRSLGGKASIIGVVGSDAHARILISGLKKNKVDTKNILVERSRQTTLKTRIIAGHQQVVRVDWEHREAIDDSLNEKVISYIRKNIHKFNGIIIEDYGKGLINPILLSEVIECARENEKVVTVDPKEEHFVYYQGVTCITPNRKEAENAVRNIKIKDMENRFKINYDRLTTDKEVDEAGREIMDYLGLESLLITLGEQGMCLFEKSGKITHIPTVAQEVFDVSGAGDTVIATFTLALSVGAEKIQAARIANFAAGIVVGKMGVAVTDQKELARRIK